MSHMYISFKEGADRVNQVLDGRSTLHRMHMQNQCGQQLEWFLALIQLL
jgi:hypothetical protein